MPKDRSEYQHAYYEANKGRRSEYHRAYYEANKERRKAERKPQPRTEAAKAAEARYKEKRRVLKEIEEMPHGPLRS